MNFDMPVVTDEAQLAKLVHEMTDAGSGGADHLGKRFLTDVRADRLRTAFFAKIGQQKKHSGQPLLAGIEKLIDQVFFDSAVSDRKSVV